ncbi:MAG: hypothetical protein H0X33_03380 [Taibaiella sp.]|nr:hypothetical protein [Taibaiella sp.]
MDKIFKVFYTTPNYSDDLKFEQAVKDAFQKVREMLMPDRSVMFSSMHNTQYSSPFSITGEINNADLYICNIAKNNSNAMYELGIAQGCNKPTILLIDNEATLSLDIDFLRYVNYDSNTLSNNFTHHLAKAIVSALNDPDDWKLNSLLPSNKK